VRARLVEGGVPSERIRMIPSAVDPDALRARRERALVRRELGVEDDSCCLLVLARLSRRKGIDVLLDAMARLESQPVLWVAGDGEERVALEEQARRLALPRVRFLGPREDKACLLAACDVVVMPSRAEGLGVAALEAMACGRPVVASRVGGLVDLVDEATGRRVPPDDAGALAGALDALVRSADLRHRLGSAGPARVRQGHLPDQMGLAYEALYRDVLAEAAP
jgi:glycosyltransferase involved in cell wall biosynthesis